jgi:hypothetical protein
MHCNVRSLQKDTGEIANLPEKQRLLLSDEISRPDRAERKKRNKAANKIHSLSTLEKDRQARNATGIRSARIDATFSAPKQIERSSPGADHEEELNSPRNCYVCKEEFTKLHFFYDTMCKKCGDLNYRKRFQTASLIGQVALITGSRVNRISGSSADAACRYPVIATTGSLLIRPQMLKRGYAGRDRLHIHSLDQAC